MKIKKLKRNILEKSTSTANELPLHKCRNNKKIQKSKKNQFEKKC